MQILLDSNILIYSLSKSSPKCKAAQSFIQDNQNILVVSHQVVLESLRVMTHPKYKKPLKSGAAAKAVWDVVGKLNLISPTMETIFILKEFVNKYKISGNHIFDAYMTATALGSNVNIVATDNVRDFGKFNEIKVINPFE